MLYEDYTAGTIKRWKGIKRKTTILEDGSLHQEEDMEGVKGANMGDVWRISIINSQAIERLGYPTQKPERLLERIIEASSNKGDLVADFFCGCGTTIAVAQKLHRKWLGVDISHLAVGLIERRLVRDHGVKIKKSYEIDGLPKDVASAKKLAQETTHGRFKFQDWIIETLMGGIHNPKKTADGGWDGHLTFEGLKKKEVALIEVKSGNVTIRDLRAFITTVRKQESSVGVFVCFENNITKGMRIEAKDHGYFNKDSLSTPCDKIQIISVEDLMDGKNVQLPQTKRTTLKVDNASQQEFLL